MKKDVLVKPVALLLPDSIPAETILSLLLVLLLCFLVGATVQTRTGQVAREKAEKTFFERIPGYALIRSLTQEMAGASVENVWKPALVQTDEGLIPAFIIEEFEDGRYTVFIPSIPTPLAGAVMILERSRVHPLDLPFTEALGDPCRAPSWRWSVAPTAPVRAPARTWATAGAARATATATAGPLRAPASEASSGPARRGVSRRRLESPRRSRGRKRARRGRVVP